MLFLSFSPERLSRFGQRRQNLTTFHLRTCDSARSWLGQSSDQPRRQVLAEGHGDLLWVDG